MSGDLFGGLVKGLTDLMPQDDPEVKAFSKKTEVSGLKKKEAGIYEEIGRRAVQDGKTADYADLMQSLDAVHGEIQKAEAEAEDAKRAAEQAQAEKDMYTCPSCGAQNAPGTKFCSECGTPIEAPQSSGHCVNCGAELEPGAKFCGECGAKQ